MNEKPVRGHLLHANYMLTTVSVMRITINLHTVLPARLTYAPGGNRDCRKLRNLKNKNYRKVAILNIKMSLN